MAYHRVREAVAAKIIIFQHMEGKENPADVLTKFLPHATFWPFIKPLLFWRGETNEALPTSSMRGVTGVNRLESGRGTNSTGLSVVTEETANPTMG